MNKIETLKIDIPDHTGKKAWNRKTIRVGK